MRPESGFSKPWATFSRTDLPLPASPRTTRVSPRPISKETSWSATVSLKLKETRWKQRTLSRAVVAASIYRLTNTLVTKLVRTKIQTEATTTACVVERPTPCVPPLVRMP